MAILPRGQWYYDLNITAWEGKFVWHVVRFKIDPARAIQVASGTWVAGGIAATREEAEREGVPVIDRDSQYSA